MIQVTTMSIVVATIISRERTVKILNTNLFVFIFFGVFGGAALLFVETRTHVGKILVRIAGVLDIIIASGFLYVSSAEFASLSATVEHETLYKLILVGFIVIADAIIIILTFKFRKRVDQRNLLRVAILIIAIISFIMLFVFAKQIALLIIGELKGGNTIDDVAFVIRCISFAILVVPLLSISRGYLQGHKYVTPSSVSQVLEQVIRIAVILMGSYIVINVLNKSVTLGVGIAVLGAFFGGLAAYLYIKYICY